MFIVAPFFITVICKFNFCNGPPLLVSTVEYMTFINFIKYLGHKIWCYEMLALSTCLDSITVSNVVTDTQVYPWV